MGKWCLGLIYMNTIHFTNGRNRQLERIKQMEKFEIELVRRDKVKVELDPEYFTEEWFEEFRQYFYDYFTLKDLAEHIAYNVVHNNATEIEGFGIPLRDGERPYWIKDNQEVNEHINVIYNSYATEVEYE